MDTWTEPESPLSTLSRVNTALGFGGGGVRSNKPMDPRYNRRFEYKYDEKNRLTERTEFSVTVIFRGVTCTSTKGTKRGAALRKRLAE